MLSTKKRRERVRNEQNSVFIVMRCDSYVGYLRHLKSYVFRAYYTVTIHPHANTRDSASCATILIKLKKKIRPQNAGGALPAVLLIMPATSPLCLALPLPVFSP